MSKFAFRGDEDDRTFGQWKEVAKKEKNYAMGKPNAFAAARQYSAGGKRTVIRHSQGPGYTVFEDKNSIHRETNYPKED